MVEALIKEIEIRSSFSNKKSEDVAIISKDEIVETIYFGGGTPSLLSEKEISIILSVIKKNYVVADNAEITLEANPDDINSQTLIGWKNAGVNRLSIGIQSFLERDLLWMNRAHNAQQALNSINLSRQAGFDNFSIDLIFGTPRLSDEEWKKNIQTVIDFDIPHVSSYALTVEPKTALQKMIDLKKKEDVSSDAQSKQYQMLMETMRGAGYDHYEISNFAKPGFRSRHNSSYWQSKKYIGIGPSAHSFDGKIRMWNKANNVLYIKSLHENIIPFEKEILAETQKLNEYVMTSLRTIEGMNLNFIEENFSKKERERIENIIEHKIQKENILLENDTVFLTDEGKLFADRIAVELFL